MKKLLLLLFLFFAVTPALATDTFVIFNQKTLIYHKPNCIAARRCTKNCIRMPKADAEEKGRPCEICGG